MCFCRSGRRVINMPRLTKVQENSEFVKRQKELGVDVCMVSQFPHKSKATIKKAEGVLAIDGNKVILTSE